MGTKKVTSPNVIGLLWSASDYREILRCWIESQPNSGRGAALKLAKAAGIQAGLFSKVIRGEREFTYEQGFAVSTLLELDRLSMDHFIDLVAVSRAGRQSPYGRFLNDRIERRRKQRIEKSKKKLEPEDVARARLELEEKSYYFSSWHPSFICLCARLPGLDSDSRIANALMLDPAVVREHVAHLVKMGLLKRDLNQKIRFQIEPDYEVDSFFASQSMRNYRLFAMDVRDRKKDESRWSFGGCDVYTIEEAEKIKNQLKEFVREVMYQRTVSAQNAESEVAYCLNVDWLPVARVSKD